MFTGLVEELAAVAEASISGQKRQSATMRLVVKAPHIGKGVKVGDSIAVNGCCLTVIKNARTLLSFDVGSETLSRTTFGRLKKGSQVNLERSMQLGDRLGGHLVTGHIDSLATLVRRRDEGDWSSFVFRAHPRLLRQIASKGSVAVDGVSLTVVDAEIDRFGVALIPYSLAHTTLGKMLVGDVANLETDLLAKYVERQLESRPGLSLNQVKGA